MDEKVMIISNVDKDDKTFESDMGTWNVTRARNDCKAGKHKLYGFCVDELYNAIQNVEVDQHKVKIFSSKKILKELPPIILVGEQGKIWVIEGHHTIHAHRRVGKNRITGFVIEEKDNASYKVYYNGERIAPWQKGK
jgi:hypothetical protein